MTYAIVYSSRTGNTKQLADALHACLPEGGCVYFGAPSPEALQAELIFAGFWTDKGSCDAAAAEFLGSITGQKVFLFGTAGFGGRQEYFQKILENVKKNLRAESCLTGEFMCQGRMPEAVRRRYEAMPEGAQRQAALDNFDRGLSHPDEADLAALGRAAAAVLSA